MKATGALGIPRLARAAAALVAWVGRLFGLSRTLALGASGALVAIYLVTRLLSIWEFPQNIDESWYALWARTAARDPSQAFISLAGGKEPLPTWLAAGWIHLGADPITAVRLTPLLAGVGSMFLVALLAKTISGPRAALAAAAIYAVLPFFVVYDVTGFTDPFVSALCAGGLLVMLRLAQTPRLALGVSLGLILAIGLLTKETSRLLIVFLPLSLLAFDWSAEARVRRLSRWGAAAGIACAIGIAALASLRLSSLYPNFADLREGLRRPISDVLHDPWRSTVAADLWSAAKDYVTLPVMGLAILGLAVGLGRRRWHSLFLASWTGALVATTLLFGLVGFTRYLLPAMPPVIAFAGVGAASLLAFCRRWLPEPAAGPTVAAVMLLALLPGALFGVRYLADPAHAQLPAQDRAHVSSWASGNGWPEVAAVIRARAGGVPTLVAYSRTSGPGLEFSLPDENITYTLSESLNANEARFVVRSYFPLPIESDPATLRPIFHVLRVPESHPAAGVYAGNEIIVYERASSVAGRASSVRRTSP